MKNYLKSLFLASMLVSFQQVFATAIITFPGMPLQLPSVDPNIVRYTCINEGRCWTLHKIGNVFYGEVHLPAYPIYGEIDDITDQNGNSLNPMEVINNPALFTNGVINVKK
jgi:hypothetical protein